MFVSIQATETALSATCKFQGQTGTAQVHVPSHVTDTQLVIEGSAQDSKSVGNLDCSINIAPMSFDYQLSGDTLTLTAQGQSIPFTRIK